MYVRVKNGIPEAYTIRQLKQDNPQVSFPKDLSDELLSAYSVFRCTRPSPPVDFDSNAWTVVDDDFTLIDGGWTRPYKLQALPEATASTNTRNKRNALLAMSDWTQLSDAPIDQQSWSVYRQQLRDVTLQEGFPFQVVWPSAPV